MRSYQQFLAELKRRKVFRVAAVYGVASFVLLQVADLLGQGLRLGDTFLPFITAIVLLGFPLALILAWAFEVTPEGVRRTTDPAAGEIEGILAQPVSQRWPAGLLALVGVAALVLGAWWVGRQTAVESADATPDGSAAPADVRLAFVDPSEDPRPSLAVLPFVNMSADPEQEYFSDGITEEILNTLAKVRELRVAGRTSAFAFKGENKDLREIGNDLGVRYLIEGSVRKAGQQLRITAQLIDATDGSHLWSEQYDRILDNIFDIQTEIAEAIAAALTVPLGLNESEGLVIPTADIEAYDLYLAGRARMRERGTSVLEAVDLFEAAIARDSTWAPAWAGLAESRSLVPYYTEVAPDSAGWADQLGAAESAALTALELDPGNASATVALANVYRDRWEWDEAEAAYIRALTVDPDNVEAHQQYAEFLNYLGRDAESLLAARRALALDRSPIRLNVAGFISADNGYFDQAIELFEEGILLDPEGRVDYLRDNLFRVREQAGRWEEWWAMQVESATEAGASEQLAEFLRLWPEQGPPPVDMDVDAFAESGSLFKAHLWMEVGRPDQALVALSDMDAPPFGTRSYLMRRRFDALRDDPRFKDLLEKNGLAGRRPIREER